MNWGSFFVGVLAIRALLFGARTHLIFGNPILCCIGLQYMMLFRVIRYCSNFSLSSTLLLLVSPRGFVLVSICLLESHVAQNNKPLHLKESKKEFFLIQPGPRLVSRAPKDHINTRILQDMPPDIRLILSRSSCRVPFVDGLSKSLPKGSLPKPVTPDRPQ